MKTLSKLATLTVMMAVLAVHGFSQDGPQTAKPLNVVRGVLGPLGSNSSWSGYSAVGVIAGGGVIPVSTKLKTTVFYLGFTAGTTADVSGMVLYTTARRSLTVTAVTPITLGGVSHPSINLASKTVCPVQPLAAATPCVVRLDPVTLTLSALSDYYLVVYFTAGDSNNNTVGATQPSFGQSSLNGWFQNSDLTHLTVGESLPNSNTGAQPDFLMYVMTN